MDSVKLLSATIDLLRFPLAIMVIFIHMNPEVSNLFDADYSTPEFQTGGARF